jgi:putative tryptophan/tyrosine transport system substrate-binding protein
MQFDELRRREFITLLGGAAAVWPLAARAQQPERMRRIGVLMGLTNDAEGQARIRALLRGLQALGWAVGHNLRIEYRWAGGDADLMRAYAKELVAMTPDVILASGTPASTALNRETRSIPVVFVQVTDPVGSGFVESFAKAGGNMTGFTNYEDRTISGKWLEILKEMEPSVVRVAVTFNPTIFPWRHICLHSRLLPGQQLSNYSKLPSATRPRSSGPLMRSHRGRTAA